MDDMAGKPGFFERIVGFVHRHEDEEYEDDRDLVPTSHVRISTNHTNHLTVRRQVVSFQDAIAAADGIKRGETQVINLSMTAPDLREKIKDFMCGVNYSAEGTWAELGENVYLLSPSTTYVEVAPASPALSSQQDSSF